jgi:hypothetical protein
MIVLASKRRGCGYDSAENRDRLPHPLLSHAKELRYTLKQFVSRIQVAANFSGGIRK